MVDVSLLDSIPAAPNLAATKPSPAARAPISKTPRDFWKLIEGLTALQAQAVLAPFMEQTMVVSGNLYSVSEVHFPLQAPPFIQVTIAEGRELLSMFFRGENWVNRLALLSKGDHITVAGAITDLRPNLLNLDDCELL